MQILQAAELQSYDQIHWKTGKFGTFSAITTTCSSLKDFDWHANFQNFMQAFWDAGQNRFYAYLLATAAGYPIILCKFFWKQYTSSEAYIAIGSLFFRYSWIARRTEEKSSKISLQWKNDWSHKIVNNLQCCKFFKFWFCRSLWICISYPKMYKSSIPDSILLLCQKRFILLEC